MRALLFTPVLLLTLLPSPALAQPADGPEETVEARLESLVPIPCPEEDQEGCLHAELTVIKGSMKGERVPLDLTPRDYLGGHAPGYRAGDTLLLQTQEIDGYRSYAVSDVVRRPALWMLLVLFLIATTVFGGLAGIRSFLGMAASFLVIFFLLIPAVLRGVSPLAASIGCALLIMALTFVLSHGWNAKTAAALAGTAGSLAVTGLLAWAFTGLAHLYGLDEETVFLLSEHPLLDTRGLLLAGILIGALGVLDDVTISQASAVLELRGANPRLSARELYVRAVRIGRDHIAAAVNTLVLAYAGSSLPLLLLLADQPLGESWGTMINREALATEIVRTLVGSIGLLSAVPLTTWLAALLAVRIPAKSLPHGGHGHAH